MTKGEGSLSKQGHLQPRYVMQLLFWLSTIAQESQQNTSKGRVLAFYRIAPCLNAVSKAPFTRIRTNLCTGENLQGYTLRLHGTGYPASRVSFDLLEGDSARRVGTGGTGRRFERLSVQL